ncbi:MAG: prepilin-type N-terminal cleavage/methylation domain-containing protein [Candidatus Falkowbacteria bacterium]|nr:prepilin-type N-terminal cleavage/methylation domain-containing protein [Candidatus Falkowbacteria bacterium]
MRQNKKLKSAFTLIELLVVIAIIGVLSTMAIIALGNARAKARDSKRVADIKQISTALELYYSDYNSYPTIITPGNALTSPDGTRIYIAAIPNNPAPRNDNNCGNNNYTYAATSDNANYSLNFCLGNNVASTPAGINSTSNSGLNTAPGLVTWYKFDEGSGATAIDSSGNNRTGTWSGAGVHYATGKTGSYAGQFNGIDDFVQTNYSANFANQSFSLSFWVNMAAKSRGDIVANKDMSLTGNGFHIWEESGQIYGLRLGDGVTASLDARGGFYPATALVWKHIVIVINRQDNTYYDYTNGAAAVPAGWTQSYSLGSGIGPIGNQFNMQIGGNTFAYYEGLIDDLRIYNRALSLAEAKAIYDASK